MDDYLVDLNQEREDTAIRHLLQLRVIIGDFLVSLGIHPEFSWFILGLQHDRLVSGWKGDIDILAGPLAWSDSIDFSQNLAAARKEYPSDPNTWVQLIAAYELAKAGLLKWPPDPIYLVGVEAKCAYLSPNVSEISKDSIKSAKSSPEKTASLRRQIDRLLQMGLDKVALVDILANPPVGGSDGAAWITSAGVANLSVSAMREILANRLPAESCVGHWAISVGAVVGGNEAIRGAIAPCQLRVANANPLLCSEGVVQSRRNLLNSKIIDLLEGIPKPISFPVILVDCKKCHKIHDWKLHCANA